MGAHRTFSKQGQGLGIMASAERQPITLSGSGALSMVRGAEPMVSGSDDEHLLKLKALKHLYA